jgi:glycine dehydrogenase subunit 2
MIQGPGAQGLILEEPLLWEKGKPGRTAYSMPERDVPAAEPARDLVGDGPDFPDLSEVDVVRHYTRLSSWNFGIDTGMYPLGSCTMKYNPKINEKMAATPGLASAHPLLEEHLSQGILKLQFELQEFLKTITGMDAFSLQPSAGAQGELTAMLMFAAYFRKKE